MRLFAIITAIFFSGVVQAQQLSFYQESLNFELDSTHFYVSGMYFLRNSNNNYIETKIYYPYVYSTDLIDTITIYNCNTMENIEPFKGQKGHWFNVNIPAKDSVILHIKYKHKHNDSTATYILLSTQYWKKPFVKADYTLRVKNGIEVNKLFLPVDSTWQENNYQYYYWQRFYYMPQSNFTVDFKK